MTTVLVVEDEVNIANVVRIALERFYLYERCGKDRPVGTGLGLAIVKELTAAMGGEVHAYGAPGEGTTFVVRWSPPRQTARPLGRAWFGDGFCDP
jgi:signal transduction histidine kinase